MGTWAFSALASLLAAGWTYQKFHRHSGGNSRQSLIAATFVWLLTFLLLGSILTAVL